MSDCEHSTAPGESSQDRRPRPEDSARGAPSRPRTSVIVVTRNRVDSLRATLASCVTQTVRPEVIVVDDASDDGTATMVAREFPTVKLLCNDRPEGYIVGRNRAIAASTRDIVFSIDDDAIYTSVDTLAEVLPVFEHQSVAVASMPFVNVRSGVSPVTAPPAGAPLCVAYTFVGTAHALRRDAFLRAGGYRECLFHQGEETDLALRLLALGGFVALVNSTPIHHFESPQRDWERLATFGRRNDILIGILNVPARYLPAYLVRALAVGALLTIRHGWRRAQFRGVQLGFQTGWTRRRDRKPLDLRTYRASEQLRRRRIVPLDQAEKLLNDSLATRR